MTFYKKGRIEKVLSIRIDTEVHIHVEVATNKRENVGNFILGTEEMGRV